MLAFSKLKPVKQRTQYVLLKYPAKNRQFCWELTMAMEIELSSLMMSVGQAMLGSNRYKSLIKLTGRAECIAKIWHDYGLDGHDLTPINMKKHDPLNHFIMVLPYLLWAKYKTRLNCLNGIQICIQMVDTAI